MMMMMMSKNVMLYCYVMLLFNVPMFNVMFQFDNKAQLDLTWNISKQFFLLIICIAKDLIWTISKSIFSIFRFFLHPQIPDIQKLYLRQILSYHNKLYINGKLTLMESLFIQLSVYV